MDVVKDEIEKFAAAVTAGGKFDAIAQIHGLKRRIGEDDRALYARVQEISDARAPFLNIKTLDT